MRRAFPEALLLGVLLVGSASAPALAADGSFLPGHSHTGEVFDRGPRQGARLIAGTGKIHFPVTSKDPRVQKYIEQGIGQLHGFSYYEAERSFRQAAAFDPNCGIAHWGMSLANPRNATRAREFAAQAAAHKAGLSPREQMYIDALGNDAGYKALIQQFPDDLEAKAFAVWRIWHRLESGPTERNEAAEALALAHEILAVDPLHPIHHAVIHLVDEGNHQAQGLTSAAKSGESAPGIGHMWHMPTHIYYPLRRYPEAAWQLEACLRTENARIERDHILPDQVELYAHNNEWLVRTLMQLGRFHDARDIAKQMIALPRHPLLNVLEPPDQEQASDEKKEKPKEAHGSSAYYGRERLIQVLRRYEYWGDLIEACRSGEIEPTRIPSEQAKVHAALGAAYYCKGENSQGDAELQALRELRDQQLATQQAAIDEAKQLPEHQRTAALRAAERRLARPLAGIQRRVAELESYRRIATGFFVSRTQLIWGLVAIGTGEAVGLWLLRRRWMQAVLAATAGMVAAAWLGYGYWSLVNMADESTNVDFAIVTRKQIEVGDTAAAVRSARQYSSERPQQVRPLANLTEALYADGRIQDARACFQTLRELAGAADLDAPPFARLNPIARAFGWPTDWRLPDNIQKTLAGRPPLAAMGPRMWRPWIAPDWKLRGAQGREHSLADFRGKPVILVFFLGAGCSHCQAQLAAFVKEHARLAELGWQLVAVSSDDATGVQKLLASYKPEPFPFLMLADPKLNVFQSYRAYDDFEHIALHGTYLIDGQGLVRWCDVSFEPFMDVRFLMVEFKRLLSLAPVPRSEEPARPALAATSS
jgi:peroxiredoxin/multidrug efflux pump subunit AcrA (membrane-fusion protein)